MNRPYRELLVSARRTAVRNPSFDAGVFLASCRGVTPRPQPFAQLVLLSGPRGAGKTGACAALFGAALAAGIDVAGVVSPPVFADGVKVGIDLLDLRSRVDRPLAIRNESRGCGVDALGWRFDEAALAWANACVRRIDRCGILILDELGPLEFVHGGGLACAIPLISSRRYRQACVVVRPALLQQALALWPWGRVVHLDPAAKNGDSVSL